ncbi:MAG: CBS and ACT domain-containing protein [Desulfofustis sp.]|nr:CBS and ACT domain-containing protein [Desulfofustis sp.]MBT8344797.1 CBS and ACT domain-containing protein [Desulfofustis sp.]
MHVGRIMHTNLITVSPKATLVEAREMINRWGIDHLLVVDAKEKLVGIISDRDLKLYWASPANTLSSHELSYLLEKILVKMIMIKTVKTITTETTIERAAFIMQTNNINALPVMENDELVGIITSTDVMGVLLQAIGMSEDSVRIAVLVKDRIGAIADVSSILRDKAINIQSLITLPLRDYPDINQLVLRLSGEDGPRAVALLNKNHFKVLTRYVKDLSPYLPDLAT